MLDAKMSDLLEITRYKMKNRVKLTNNYGIYFWNVCTKTIIRNMTLRALLCTLLHYNLFSRRENVIHKNKL